MNARVPISCSFLLWGVSLAIALTGCSRSSPNAPPSSRASARATESFLAAGANGGAYFPLKIGNRWHAESIFHSTITTPDGGTSTYDVHADITSELIGTETIAGQTYVVEQIVTNEDGPFGGPFNTWLRYRQDAAGLYEADVDLSLPPVLDSGVPVNATNATRPETVGLPSSFARALSADHRDAYEAAWNLLQSRIAAIRTARAHASGNGVATAPGGVLSGELTRLAYPLRPAAAWVIRDDPFFGSSVEANGSVEVPAGKFSGSRIRITSDFFGPNDVVHVWFSRSGPLAFRYHVEFEVTDVDGNPIGTMSADYDETLQDLLLVK